jgi:hypothetical protein
MPAEAESDAPDVRHWPVRAWIKLRLPPREEPVALMAGPPPPAEPPLELLKNRPVTTDPRKRVFVHEELLENGEWALRIIWDADDPGVLDAEYRAPGYESRLPRERVREFWRRVKERVRELGPLPVLGADPRA